MLHIDALSDDEIVTPPEQTGPGACVQRPAKRRKPGEVALVARDSDLRRDLRSIVDSKCFCSKRSRQTHRPSCFEPFREPAQFKSLFDLRKILKQKNKEDADKQVFDILARQGPSVGQPADETGFRVLGQRVCLRGLCKLLGVGSSRMQRLRGAAIANQSCPLDGRLKKCGLLKRYRAQSHARELIHAFLTECYVKHAEPVPEVHAERERHQTDRVTSFRVRKGKRPRRFKKRDDRLTETTAPLLRLLPPGTYTDYHRLFLAKNPTVKASLKLFTRVWEEGFAGRLQIRTAGQHTKCSICVLHKMLVRRLSDNAVARESQLRFWNEHMELQFADRQVYWSNRAMSRLGQDQNGARTITIICDSMDHSKWCVPRSSVVASSKAFQQLHRPYLTCTGVLVHGHLVCIAFSEAHVAGGSNYTCEVLAYIFSRLASSGIDLRSYRVNCQFDNASKEGKNNAVCRLLSLAVARCRLGCARMCFTMSGHSHEDIDQFFLFLAAS
ncbi:Uncharacterized protein SCF082_LOCUS51747 [Durusdinium trenchii]|uniref:DUF7869 domain-containing protein n=1 Tax=Durusdinium trenchii TaxID=1381693 RepID=A0ABP0SGW6_9DINO